MDATERHERHDGSIIQRRRPISDVVYSKLHEMILSRTLKSGHVLRENAVADMFGIGRMPVAVALRRLEEERLVHRRAHMHGMVVGTDLTIEPQHIDIQTLNPRLPEPMQAQLKIRNWRTLIYAEVEKEIASCLMFGKFRIRSQALAEHFGVSRTIANELLVRLERVGAVRQDTNSHWYAGPLTQERIRELYQMRIMLEPAALLEAVPRLSQLDLATKLDRVKEAEKWEARSDVSLLHRLEVDLHHDVVLQCVNQELRTTLYRCQLPLITAHLSFGSYGEQPEIPVMLGWHREILQRLVDGKAPAAARALVMHLEQSMADSPVRAPQLRPLDPSALSPYLVPE